MHPIINIAAKAALRAGQIIRQGYQDLDRVIVEEKGKNDFVTNIDRASERAIVDVITHSYPDHDILTEESGELKSTEHEFQWIIDPLDGTTNFCRGFPHFAISIGVLQKGELQHGLIYDPIRDEMFSATNGGGARLNRGRIRMPNRARLDGALIGTGFPYSEVGHLEKYLELFGSICPKVAGIRRAGSAALDLAYVAAGRLDGFWEMALKPWDIAAGAVIIKEAGGFLTDFNNEKAFLDSGNVIAGTPGVHAALLKEIKPKFA